MERTDHLDLDALLARILSEPTYAARLLVETATELEQGAPFLVVTPDVLDEAAAVAAALVLLDVPDVVAAEASERAVAAMPRTRHREMGYDYAARLRDVARGL